MNKDLQEHAGGGAVPTSMDVSPSADGDKIVISGMAGLYPDARYVKDLENILYNKLNPISRKVRWQYNHPEVTQYAGIVPNVDRFDAQFFKVHYRFGVDMDSMSRKLLEESYGAIYDAGVNPEHLSGKKIGVYVGTGFSASEKACFYASASRKGLGIVGGNKSMFANRISYWLNVKGPSVSIDESCCSSMAALEQAYQAISRGECEAAVVGGANLCLHPQSSVHYGRIMSFSKDGKTKSFSQDAAGCVNSEAVNVLFLQKAKYAKRIYAEVIHVKNEFVSVLNGDIAPRYGFYRNPADSANFLKNFYDYAGVSPNLVEYVEAVGSAEPEADISELEAIDEVFCKDRENPLLVGSVMSNIGYAEAASGISAVTKVLLGYHRGELAGNLHSEPLRSDVAALQQGRIRVLTDNQPFQRSYTAVNSMSVTGINAHVLLKGHYKPKDLNRYKSSIPYIVTISGRQKSSVKRVFNILKTQPIDPEEISLLHGIHEDRIFGHFERGFIILDTFTNIEHRTVSGSEQIEYFDGMKRPLWFVYSGMGSQWAGMGAQLMRLPIFAAAIERCHRVLKPKGIDLVHIITSPDKNVFDNILHSFVGISAIQIGITDCLLELGLVPDKIIGHSVGELGCAYADGCLTAEEMILSAYSRGRVSLDTEFIRGSMAAVGIGFKQISNMCPPEIQVACHNSAESCTISGPAEAMRVFVADLTAKGVFAKEVPCSNIAFHSRYIANAGPSLLKYLKEVIPTPRARSEKWVSTSVPQSKWDEPSAKYSSAEYHTNNLLNPVLFEETSALIPPDAVLVEVAPHALLQAIIKRSLPSSCTYIPLTRRSHPDNVTIFLGAVGKLFTEGFNPKVRVLYPKIEFPVSTTTPCLSHLVEWAHEEKWPLPLYQLADRATAASCTFVLSIHNDECNFLEGHVINGKTLVPFAFALVCAWDTLAMFLKVEKKSLDVEFRDVELFAQPVLANQQTVRLEVSMHRGTGRFEVMNENSKVAAGFISGTDVPTMDNFPEDMVISKNVCNLNSADIYGLFYERQYDYSGELRSIHSANESLSEANVLWNDNWVTFIDGLIQLNTLKHTQYDAVSQPDRIRRIIIDVKEHLNSIKLIQNTDAKSVRTLKAKLFDLNNRTRCGGVLLEDIRFRNLMKMNADRVAMQKLVFVPRFCSKFDFPTSLNVILQMVAENISKNEINVLGLALENDGNHMLEEIQNIAKNGCPGRIKVNFQHIATIENVTSIENLYDGVDLILVRKLAKATEIFRSFHGILKNNTFIVNEEDLALEPDYVHPSNFYSVVSVLKNGTTKLELARWNQTSPTATVMSTFTVRAISDLPILIHTRNNLDSQNGLIIITSYPPIAGLLSLVKQWRKDSVRNRVHVIMVNDNLKDTTPCLNELHDVNLLAYNIIEDGLWGGEYYLPLEDTSAAAVEKKTLHSDMIGNVDSLRWVHAQEPTGTGNLITVHYAGVNVGDVKRALSLIPRHDKCSKGYDYGMEFSGISESGERVMGLVPKGAASSHVRVQPELTWPVPSHWSLEDAATVPLAYVCAYYCLVIRPFDRIKPKYHKQFSVLVHGGAGALGQAVISIALSKGYRVFTTVSDVNKKRFLLKIFPELNADNIGNSRDATFGSLVLSATNRMGCDMVICCLKGQLKNTTIQCCAPLGIVLDTVQILDNENYSFGMCHLTEERSYVTVDISSILGNPKSEEMQKIHSMISDGIALGHVRPLTRVTFAQHEAPRAFRLLAASRHRGRVLLRLTDSISSRHPKVLFEESGCHVVICDKQPLGLQMAGKLIVQGLKKLHLHFLSTPHSFGFKRSLWEKLQVQLTTTVGELNDTHDITKLLQNATNLLDPVEGIYVTARSVKLSAFTDRSVATLCSSLKKFLIVQYEDKCERYNFSQINFPVTYLDVSMLETHQDSYGVTWYRDAPKAIKRALQSPNSNLLAQTKRPSHLSLAQQIGAFTDVNISDNTSKEATLEELGLTPEKSAVVSAFLRDIHNIYLEEEDAPYLTMNKIKLLEDRSTDRNFEEVNGLKMFYSHLDPDELMSTTEMVFLPTLVSHSTMRDDEICASTTSLFIIPGLEGHHARFRTLCEHLKLPAFVLQPGLDHPDETPQELALRYSKVLLKHLNLEKSFYLMGYETGVIVALELAAILEKQGKTGTVFCIGDGPDEMREILSAEMAEYGSECALQESVVRHMYGLMARGSAAPVERALRSCSSWRERVDACVRTLLGRVSHSAQYARALVEAAYARIITARRYSATPRALRSRLVLLRARRHHVPASTAGDKCSLQRYSQRALVVQDLAAPMAHATEDLRAPAIINSYLEENVLREFDNKNLCESYILNCIDFLSMTEIEN